MIIIIMIFLISSFIYAQKNDYEVSVNLGTLSGSGLGINYYLNNEIKFKFNTIFILEIENKKKEIDIDQIILLGSSLSYQLRKFGDNLSNLYTIIGTNIYIEKNWNKKYEYNLIFSLGIGIKHFLNKKIFFEYEIGIGYYTNIYKNKFQVSGNFNLGYRF